MAKAALYEKTQKLIRANSGCFSVFVQTVSCSCWCAELNWTEHRRRRRYTGCTRRQQQRQQFLASKKRGRLVRKKKRDLLCQQSEKFWLAKVLASKRASSSLKEKEWASFNLSLLLFHGLGWRDGCDGGQVGDFFLASRWLSSFLSATRSIRNKKLAKKIAGKDCERSSFEFQFLNFLSRDHPLSMSTQRDNRCRSRRQTIEKQQQQTHTVFFYSFPLLLISSTFCCCCFCCCCCCTKNTELSSPMLRILVGQRIPSLATKQPTTRQLGCCRWSVLPVQSKFEILVAG